MVVTAVLRRNESHHRIVKTTWRESLKMFFILFAIFGVYLFILLVYLLLENLKH